MKKNNLIYLNEPLLKFGYDQNAEDARDGLTLFGPFESAKGEVRVGVIGTPIGINAYKAFVADINKPIFTNSAGRPFFPGFHSVFGLKWLPEPVAAIFLSKDMVNSLINVENLYERTYQLVSLYLDEIKNYLRTEEKQIDLWYIVIPLNIWRLCRPKSESKGATISKEQVKNFNLGQRSLFPDEDAQIESFVKMYESDSDFHDQMKARILSEKITIPIQIMIEETLLLKDKKRNIFSDNMKSHFMWTQSTSTYYKLGNLPWKLHNIRKGVCYIGLVFKTLQDYQKRSGYACCAAQMFLDSGDGMVFRGNIGPWKGKNEKTYHLDTKSAKELIEVALNSYSKNNGSPPKELFIHGRTHFTDEEWDGFQQAIESCDKNINLVGVTINETDGLRLFKDNHSSKFKYGIMRGLSLLVDERNAFLWTKGYIPRTETTNHLEVARALKISVSRGECSIDIVLKDILCITKLNYNACLYGDGLPVTLRFSDKIGNILTAIKEVNWVAFPFKYYI